VVVGPFPRAAADGERHDFRRRPALLRARGIRRARGRRGAGVLRGQRQRRRAERGNGQRGDPLVSDAAEPRRGAPAHGRRHRDPPGPADSGGGHLSLAREPGPAAPHGLAVDAPDRAGVERRRDRDPARDARADLPLRRRRREALGADRRSRDPRGSPRDVRQCVARCRQRRTRPVLRERLLSHRPRERGAVARRRARAVCRPPGPRRAVDSLAARSIAVSAPCATARCPRASSGRAAASPGRPPRAPPARTPSPAPRARRAPGRPPR
jgi:hypothetical protein